MPGESLRRTALVPFVEPNASCVSGRMDGSRFRHRPPAAQVAAVMEVGTPQYGKVRMTACGLAGLGEPQDRARGNKHQCTCVPCPV